MIFISILKKTYVIEIICTWLFIVEWLEFYIKFLIWTLTTYTSLSFVTFVFLDIYLYLKTDISKKNKLILIKILKIVQIYSLTAMLVTFLLLYILSLLRFMHQVLTTLLFCELLNLLILDLQIIFLKFFLKTWVLIFIYTRIYRFFTKVFFEFKEPLDEFGNFLLKVFPIVTIFIKWIIFSLICCVIVNPNSFFYLYLMF